MFRLISSHKNQKASLMICRHFRSLGGHWDGLGGTLISVYMATCSYRRKIVYIVLLFISTRPEERTSESMKGRREQKHIETIHVRTHILTCGVWINKWVGGFCIYCSVTLTLESMCA